VDNVVVETQNKSLDVLMKRIKEAIEWSLEVEEPVCLMDRCLLWTTDNRLL
jgi:hypothetical protein